ncbi:dipeptidase [Virgibacillus halodenitrificans]|uniref:dipeptidase n=1 Tax=Virgibacillus halodenitrificans TaxID=1482 RepID=UPI00045C6A33|nr:membrane dipeptidase [Virgibacillus halodenitrificans]CDQ32067.1 Membrane dipeptidase (Peptidase family M19) [Virgibacillus halodenitrificans]
MVKLQLSETNEDKVNEITNDSIFIDGLCGNLINPEPPVRDGKTYLDRLLDSGITAQSITIASPAASFDAILKEIYSYYNFFDYYPDQVIHIKSVEDIKTAKKEKKIGVIFNLQNAKAIGSDFHKWSILSELGLRVCQLTYNEPNMFGSGCMAENDSGLTFYGKQAVREMNRQGIIVDLSHVGEKTSLEAIELSENPCIFSHSNARQITPSTKRNLTDEMMVNIAKRGGVIGLSSHAFLTHHTEGVQPTLNDYMEHFKYLLDLVGPDHISIGTDIYEYYTKFYWETKTKLLYDSPWFFETVFNKDLKRVDQYKNIIRGLIQLGLSNEDIQKILGLNLMRVMKSVWK